MNAVVILCITGLDEQFFDFFEALHPCMVEWLSKNYHLQHQEEKVKGKDDNKSFNRCSAQLELEEHSSSNFQAEIEFWRESHRELENKLENVQKDLLNISDECCVSQQENVCMVSWHT